MFTFAQANKLRIRLVQQAQTTVFQCDFVFVELLINFLTNICFGLSFFLLVGKLTLGELASPLALVQVEFADNLEASSQVSFAGALQI